MEHVDRLLKTVATVLDDAGIPYAVIGGNAVAIWVARRDVGAVRATKDVDILLRRDDIDRAAAALAPHGFLSDVVLGVPVFMEASAPLPSQGVHVIVARERVRPDAKHPAPDVDRVERSPAGYSVLELAPLVMMKLEANRRVDQVHIEDLLRIGLIDAELALQLPEDLRDRLRHVRDTMEWFTEPPVF
jgi:hypothetical protein